MDQRDNYLISDDAECFFERDYPNLNDTLLRTALRYIAVRRCDGDLAKLKPITVLESDVPTTTPLASFIELHSDRAGNILLYTCSTLPGADEALPDGWTKVDPKILRYLSQPSESFTTAIYINEKLERVIIFVKDKNSAWIKKLAQSLFQILLWLYPDRKLNKEEEKFFRAIATDDADTFYELVNKTREIVDFRRARLRNDLIGWGSVTYKTRLAEQERHVDRTRVELEQLRKSYYGVAATLEELTIQLNELTNAAPPVDEELFEFFAGQKQLSISSVHKSNTHNEMLYTISETIEYFDREEFLTCYKNVNSYLYQYSWQQNLYPKEIYNLLYALFAQSKGKIKTKCTFKLSNYSSLYPEMNFNASDRKFMPHPHIDRHGCLGENEIPIAEYMRGDDWDLAIQQTIVAAKNINFGDPTPMTNMIGWLKSNFNSREKLIITNDKKEMTIKEFLDSIKEDTEWLNQLPVQL